MPIGTSTSAASNRIIGNPAAAAPDACAAHALIPPRMASVASNCSRQYPSQTSGNQRTRKNATTTNPSGKTSPTSAGTSRKEPPPASPSIRIMLIVSTIASAGSVFSHNNVTNQPRTPYNRCARARAAEIAIQLPCMKFPRPDPPYLTC